MNGIPDMGLLALVITGYVIALPVAWLMGMLFRGVRKSVSAALVMAALFTLMIGAALLLGIIWGTIHLADTHQFFEGKWHKGQILMIIGWVIWGAGVVSAFANGEKGKRINADDAII